MKQINFEERRKKVANNVAKHGYDVYLGTRHATLHYLGGVFMPWRGVAMVTAKGEFKLFYWSGDFSRVKTEGAPMEMIPYQFDELFKKIKEELDALGISEGRIAVDLAHKGNAQPAPGILTAAEYVELHETFPNAHIGNGVDILDEIIMIKDEAELERMRYVSEIADYAFQKALKEIKAGVTENHIAGVLEQAIRDKGSYWAWSVTAGTEVGSGERTAFFGGVSQIATDKLIEPNQFLILDFHPSYDLYLCDFSVPVFFGTPNEQQKKLIACWEEAVETVFTAIKPGKVIADVVKEGIEVYKKYDLYEYCLPRFGHGLGICARTGPALNASNTDVFREGMVIAMGAHLYQPGQGGMRLEYPVYVGKNGAEQLAKTPMKVHFV
ncbi:MAG: M24 family metallopeptidase [Acetivibrionales bacterium]|jgi:Xaa-Pro dipeptidase